MKICRGCSIEQPLANFYAHPRMSDGRLNFCKECVTRRVRQHRRTHPHVQAYDRARGTRIFDNRYRTPEMTRAHNAVARAIARGTLIRPEQCEQCGATGRVEGAHFNYEELLRVRWLCRLCHTRWDLSRDPF